MRGWLASAIKFAATFLVLHSIRKVQEIGRTFVFCRLCILYSVGVISNVNLAIKILWFFSSSFPPIVKRYYVIPMRTFNTIYEPLALAGQRDTKSIFGMMKTKGDFDLRHINDNLDLSNVLLSYSLLQIQTCSWQCHE